MQLDIKKIIIIATILAVVLTIIIILAITTLPWVVIGVGSWLSPNPPKPEVTYGEFPFKLAYELNDEIKVIEDVIVCEFDGFESRGESGKYRKWKQYIKGTGEEHITILEDGDNIKLFYSPEKAAYYMGDPVYGSDSVRHTTQPKTEFINIEYAKKNEDGTITYSAFLTAEAHKKYKIKLISWEPSQPIINSFK